MATNIGDLVVRLDTITTGFTRGMMMGQRQVQMLAASANRLVNLQQPMQQVAQSTNFLARAIRNVGYGLAWIAGLSGLTFLVRSGEQFNVAMRHVFAVAGEITDDVREKMRAAALDIAKTTVWSASEAAGGLKHLVSAGFAAEEAIKALPIVAQFAQAGNFDMAKATELASGALNAMGMRTGYAALDIENLSRVTDVLALADNLAIGTTEQFAEALTNKAAPAFRLAGFNLEQAIAAIMAFHEKGIQGREVGTQLAMALRDLQKRAIMNAGAFRKFGIEVYDAAGAMHEPWEIMGDMERVMGPMSVQARRALLMVLGFQDRAVHAILAMVGSSERMKFFYEQLLDAEGTRAKMAVKQIGPLQRGWAMLRGVITDISSRIATAFGPSLENAMNGLAMGFQTAYDEANRLLAFLGENRTAQVTLKLLAMASAVWVVHAAVVGLTRAVGILWAVGTGPFAILLALGAALAALWVQLTGKGVTFADKVEERWEYLGKSLQTIWDDFRWAFENGLGFMQWAWWSTIEYLLQSFPSLIPLAEKMGEVFVGVVVGLKFAWGELFSFIREGWEDINSVLLAGMEALGKSFEIGALGFPMFNPEKFNAAYAEAIKERVPVRGPNKALEQFQTGYNLGSMAYRFYMAGSGGFMKGLDKFKQAMMPTWFPEFGNRALGKPPQEALYEPLDVAAQMRAARAAQQRQEAIAAKTPSRELTGAMEMGSKEAWTAVMGAMGFKTTGDSAANTARNTKTAAEALVDIRREVVGGELVDF